MQDIEKSKNQTPIDETNGAEYMCAVIHPFLKSSTTSSILQREKQLLNEAVGLAKAINLKVIFKETVTINSPRPATLFGTGTIKRLGEQIDNLHPNNGTIFTNSVISIVIIDSTLTPVQQRNLERAWECKVIDRTGLIIEIFGERARTHEGRLQVELASLEYQRSRLVRSWTHLERQRGGSGFMGGPGETQIETDRRQIGKRITRLKKELKDVKRTRLIHRKARKKIPYPIVALIGYTNAGKSTLFNRLTKSKVKVKNQLFATLDPTMRSIKVPSGEKVIISDTVGFISQLPHELINAFHATLEEVIEADIIIHVRDAAHVDTEIQKLDVLAVLKDLGIEESTEKSIIEVQNKIDLLSDKQIEVLTNQTSRSNLPNILVSAVTGFGCDSLMKTINSSIIENFQIVSFSIPYSDGASLAWLYDHSEILERRDDEKGMHVKFRINENDLERFKHRNKEL